MTAITYTRYELLRTLRNTRFLIFSLVFPMIMFFLIAGPTRQTEIDGIKALPYFMGGMVSWGAMAAVLASGARIAIERQAGWNRQLRITPLSVRTYFGTKVLSGYMMALLSIVVIFGAGAAYGVRLDALKWLLMAGYILVGLVPFAVMGILLGHLLTPESMGPAMGGLTSLFAVLGGSFGTIATGGVLLQVVRCLPSYWLVQAGPDAIGGTHWPTQAWVVLVVWTVVLARLARFVYQRDTKRI